MNTRLVSFVLAVMSVMPVPARAHTGGHAWAVGDTVKVWHDPDGGIVIGSLLFVSGGRARIEDLAGRIHDWPIDRLDAADRSAAEASRAHVEALNGVRTPVIPPRSPIDGDPSPAAWLFAAGLLLSAFVGARSGWLTARTLRPVAAAGLMVAACGGRSTTSPVTPTATTPVAPTPTATPSATVPAAPALASIFSPFASRVRTRTDADNLYVESDGLAEHSMMVGIRSWQQQVPLPQPYTGSNAFTIPLAPRFADRPVSARTALFNGAIALAANGVPIFNALNNRGDDAFLFGELDEFGGHSGRADDYHYHTAPFQLERTVGSANPIGVALDGFLLYGSQEPDGSAVGALDEWNGHGSSAAVYHYHGTRTYPYINGGMRGVVRVVDDHIDPQPSLRPLRPAGTPLAGATITGFASTGNQAWRLEYRIGNGTYRVDYRIEGTRYTFVFTDAAGVTRTETYTR